MDKYTDTEISFQVFVFEYDQGGDIDSADLSPKAILSGRVLPGFLRLLFSLLLISCILKNCRTDGGQSEGHKKRA